MSNRILARLLATLLSALIVSLVLAVTIPLVAPPTVPREMVIFDQRPAFTAPTSWGQPEFVETSPSDNRDFGTPKGTKSQIVVAFKHYGKASISIINTKPGQSLHVEGHYLFIFKADPGINEVSTLMSELMGRYGVTVSAYFIDESIVGVNLNNNGELTKIVNDRG